MFAALLMARWVTEKPFAQLSNGRQALVLLTPEMAKGLTPNEMPDVEEPANCSVVSSEGL